MRWMYTLALMLAMGAMTGCGGGGEAVPDAANTPEVSQEEINKKIQEGMKMGGAEMGNYGKEGMEVPGGIPEIKEGEGEKK